MKTIEAWLLHAAAGGALTVVFSAAARALPQPQPMGSRFYQWFYGFVNNLLINWDLTRTPEEPK